MSLPFYVSYVGLWIVVVLETVLLLGLIRTVYRNSGGASRMDNVPARLAPGTRLPAFEVRDARGALLDSRTLVGRATALLFVSPSCDSCSVTLEELDALESKTRGNVVVFCLADETACGELIDRYGLGVRTVVDAEHRIAGLLRVTSAPTAVLVDRLGNVETYGHPRTPVDLERLLTIEPTEEGFAGDPNGLVVHAVKAP